MIEPTPSRTIAAERRSPMQRYWLDIALWKRIFAALLLGVLAGLLFGEAMEATKWMGDLFIRLIRMLVVPLVLVVVVAGLAALGDPRRLGSIGLRTLVLYLLTTALAVAIGITVASLFQPGVGVVLGSGAEMPPGAPRSFGEQLIEIVPINPIEALAKGAMLSVIFLAILVGVGCILVGEEAKPLVRVFEAASAVFLKLVQLVMELAPFGVFALIAFAVGNDGLGAFLSILKIALCVVVGVAIQLIFTHGGLVWLGARLSPVRFFRNASEAMLMGFSTASSSATLPVVMAVADRKMGIKPPIVSTVLPLGASMSMDGTAMYMSILCMFALQSFGIVLAPAELLLMAMVTVTVALGTAPIPGSSLFLIAGILASIGIPPEQAALVVAFVLPFDRPLDMIRTVPNVTSDLAVATVVAVKEGEIDLDVFRGQDKARAG
ncbi:MAG: dicarboxylate/amino acid:cation symporter [Sandaracinobacteroides sp.]